MKRIPAIAAGLGAGIVIATAAGVIAQPFGGMGPGLGMGMGPGHGAVAAADIGAYTDARLAALKSRLGINSSQEGAWQAFAAQLKQQTEQMQAMHAQMWNSAGTAPERLSQHAQAMQQRAAAMNAMSQAFGGLYAVLTPEQKSVADQLFAHGGLRGARFGAR